MLTLTSTVSWRCVLGGVQGRERRGRVGRRGASLGAVDAGQLGVPQLADILVGDGGVQLLDTGLGGRWRVTDWFTD